MKDQPESLLLRDLDKRTANYKRNQGLESLLKHLEGILGPVDAELCQQEFTAPQHPVLLLVGNPRSGTTLMMQFLARLGVFAVPSNLLSRFYYAPHIGALIQKLLCDPAFAYKQELPEFEGSFTFKSDLGKTVGALSPNDFYYFWRRYLPIYDPQPMTAEQLQQVDRAGMNAGLAGIEAGLEKPVALKAKILQYNLDCIPALLDKPLVVYLSRNPFYIMQSTLIAREKFYGTRDIWWSVKPPEYDQLKDLSVHEQIAGQIYHTHRRISAGLSELPEVNRLHIDYGDFCADPNDFLADLAACYERLGYRLESPRVPQEEYQASESVRIPEADVKGLCDAYAALSGEAVSP